MVKHWCLNGTMVDTDKYSSPVPLIGLYTAAATLVCLVLIASDMWAGFWRRKLWLPCRFFSLNSVTLTLISISSKLPVDLTSPMPSSQDQLSKLTGTVFICMSMGFLMPSLGIIGEFESQANLLALSIFVVTVVVNICIQIATGVISSFIVEHSIIMFCMLTLTILLWVSAFIVNDVKGRDIDQNKDLIRKGIEESLLRRLQVCYLYGYYSSPQFVLCSILMCATISLICIICVVVLAEVLLRSLAFEDLKFCNGVSAYGWSMWIIVGTQVLTIAVIGIAMGCRWLTFASQLEKFIPVKYNQQPYVQIAIPFYMRNTPKCFDLSFRFLYDYLVFPFANLAAEAMKLLTQSLAWLCHKTRGICRKQGDERSIEDFNHLLQTHRVRISERVLRKGVEDMEKWMELNRRKPPQCLTDMLSTVNDVSPQFDLDAGGGVSCLSILLLVEMAKVSIPSHTAIIMEEILDEMFQIICFIDSKINDGNFKSKVKSMTAMVIRMGRTAKGVIHAKVVERPMDNIVEPQAELDHALNIIRKFHRSFEVVVVRDEARAIGNSIRTQSYASLDELSDQIQLFFVNMLRALLSDLPKAIFNHIAESPAEEYEDRVRLGLKFLCKLETVEPYLRWSFPVGSNITSLIGDQVSTTVVTGNSSPMEEGNRVCIFAPATEDAGEIQLHQPDDNV